MSRSNARKWLERSAVSIVTTFSTVLFTAFLKGEPLTGLEGFWRVLGSQYIPVWLFAVVLIVAVFGSQGSLKAARERKKSLHIVWDEGNSAWHMGSAKGRPAMQIMASATFTGAERDSIQIISAAAGRGTTDLDLMRPIICPQGIPVRENIMIFVQPPLAKEGERWKGRIVLLDQYNRKYKSPRMILEHR